MSKGNDDRKVTEIELSGTAPPTLGELRGTLSEFVTFERQELTGIDIDILPSPLGRDDPGSPNEPVFGPREQDDIQGNIIPGFNKDHQHFLFYNFGNRQSYAKVKSFLRWLVPYLSSMEEVMAFRRLWRARRLKLGTPYTFLCSTWVNIAFSHPGIAKLVGRGQAAAFDDRSFRQGMGERSAYLGDPTSSKSRGHRSRWVLGGPKKPVDIVIIVASDSPRMLEEMVELIDEQAAVADLQRVFQQRGDTLPGDLRGHEHFGFRDGVSQPGVRGKLSNEPGDYITPRYLDSADPRSHYFAKPGQLLVWPGQFLLGEPRQSSDHLYDDFHAASNFPSWATRGSYLVIRRLHQDVPTFWKFATIVAGRMGLGPVELASKLVGRWPSGAPLLRVPGADNPALGGDEFANNHFLFDDDTRPSRLKEIFGYPGDNFPDGTADFLAEVCPHFAHIRKMNLRDSVTELGKPEDNLTRAILRRGIPYGPPLVGERKLTRDLIAKDRGLMFLCYVSNIEDQFEFLQRRWANSPSQPNIGGHDPIIGQNGETSSRIRRIDFRTEEGRLFRVRFKLEWVTPTGGEYFFAPTIGAVRDVLAA